MCRCRLPWALAQVLHALSTLPQFHTAALQDELPILDLWISWLLLHLSGLGLLKCNRLDKDSVDNIWTEVRGEETGLIYLYGERVKRTMIFII